jgi:hypothetical protein
MGASWELQKAVRTRLRADATLAALLATDPVAGGAAVLDHVPQPEDGASAAAFPYVTVGDDTEQEWDTDNTTGREHTLTLHAWSRYLGKKQVKDILDAMKAALHNQPLTVSGLHVVLVLAEYAESFVDPDGITRHGVLRVRVLTEGA